MNKRGDFLADHMGEIALMIIVLLVILALLYLIGGGFKNVFSGMRFLP
ncbi:hypothetical protein HY641_04030 [Candidatus Woesearchaeota archaeon]|nr:hypothetical protein [Candidatus Woesearchaeota archaeon]